MPENTITTQVFHASNRVELSEAERQPTSERYAHFLHFSCVLATVRFETNRESSRNRYKNHIQDEFKLCGSFSCCI